MLSFRQYLIENKDSVPQGVLVYGDKIFVGADHEKPISIGDERILDKIKSHGSKHGFYFEGDGGDAKQNALGLSSTKDYKDGWDEDRMKSIADSGIKPHNLAILYSNVDVNWNKTKQNFKGKTVFDGIHSWAKAGSSTMFGGAEVTQSHVEDFLKASSEKTGQDFLSMARKTPASQGKEFLKKIEKIAWPDDWNTKKRTAGPELLVDRENQERNAHVVDNMGPGVYVAGAGHLKQVADLLKQRNKKFTMHGGSQIK